MHKTTIRSKIISAFFIAITLTIGYLFAPKVFFSLDNKLRDFMFRTRGELPKSNKVIIVDIDEQSLKEYGQWPWSRNLVSKLLTNLSNYGAGIIGLDIVFAEEDRTSPHRLLKKFPEIKTILPNYDAILANCFATAPIIGGYVFHFEEDAQKEPPIIPAVVIRRGMKDNITILKPKSVVLNIPLLQDALYSSGFFNNLPDPDDGMIRSVPLIMEYDFSIYTSLALEMIRVYKNANRVEVKGDELGVTKIVLGNFEIPVDPAGRVYVNFRGKSHYYRYISAKDIIQGKAKTKDIEGKFVLVGTSALGLYDIRAIPLTSNIAGVEIHANLIDNLLEGDILHPPFNYQLINMAIIWFCVLLTMIVLSFTRSLKVLLIGIVLIIGLYFIFSTLLFQYHLVLNFLFPFLAIILSLFATVAIDYVLEHRQKVEAKKILGKKVSPRVMDYLIKHSEEQLVSSREVEASIFFSDIVGFTAISEKVGSPDKLISMLNTYMTPMVESIIKQQGTIDKFIGDAVMAYWNAPIKVAGHADKALQSAIEQIEMLEAINKIVTPTYGVTIDIGIGLHTGLVTAGDMGAEGRSDYTIIGDNVNLASRLEGLTRQYDVQILISKNTYSQLKEKYFIRPIDLVEVKGKTTAIEIFEVICNTKNISQEEFNLYNKTLNFFREENLKEALKNFKKLEENNPSKLYQHYIKRCEKFIDNPTIPFTPILKMYTK